MLKDKIDHQERSQEPASGSGSARPSAGRPSGPGCTSSRATATSTPRPSTTTRARSWSRPRPWRRTSRPGVKNTKNLAGCEKLGEIMAQRLQGEEHREDRLRPGHLPLPRPDQGPGRGPAQGRADVLSAQGATTCKSKTSRTRSKQTAAVPEPIDEIGELKDQVINIRRVTKVVKGGKNLSFSALVAVGNERGTVGIGKGKAREVPAAIAKAVENAKKHLIRVQLAETTIPHFVRGEADAGVGRPAARLQGDGRHRRRRGPGHHGAGRDQGHPDQVASAAPTRSAWPTPPSTP